MVLLLLVKKNTISYISKNLQSTTDAASIGLANVCVIRAISKDGRIHTPAKQLLLSRMRRVQDSSVFFFLLQFSMDKAKKFIFLWVR